MTRRWVFAEGSPYPTEEPPPAELTAGEVVVLTAYGSLFLASAQVVEAQLPRVVEGSRGAVVERAHELQVTEPA